MTNPFGSVIDAPAVGQVLLLPMAPLPYELITLYAPEPTGGRLPAAQPPMGWLSVARPIADIFRPVIATLASGEISPNTGARKELPHVPRMVKSSIGAQLNDTFGLLVPPTSLYWSWRQENSSSSRRSNGRAF